MSVTPSRKRRSDPDVMVTVARDLFIRYGVRRTSIEDVAKAADVAKGTVYLAFESKDALFRAVCEDVCRELLSRADKAADGIADPQQRMVARLEAKYLWLHGWVSSSPHASELLSSKDSVAADVLRKMDKRFAASLADDLKLAFPFAKAESAAEAARLLMRTARACGLADEGDGLPSERVVRERMRLAFEAVLMGLATTLKRT